MPDNQPLPPAPEALGDLAAFAELDDPRSRRCRYPLEELLLVAFAGVASGAEDWVSVCEWGQFKTGAVQSAGGPGFQAGRL